MQFCYEFHVEFHIKFLLENFMNELSAPSFLGEL